MSYSNFSTAEAFDGWRIDVEEIKNLTELYSDPACLEDINSLPQK